MSDIRQGCERANDFGRSQEAEPRLIAMDRLNTMLREAYWGAARAEGEVNHFMTSLPMPEGDMAKWRGIANELADVRALLHRRQQTVWQSYETELSERHKIGLRHDQVMVWLTLIRLSLERDDTLGVPLLVYA